MAVPITFACGLYGRTLALLTGDGQHDGIYLNYLAIDPPRKSLFISGGNATAKIGVYPLSSGISPRLASEATDALFGILGVSPRVVKPYQMQPAAYIVNVVSAPVVAVPPNSRTVSLDLRIAAPAAEG